MQIVIDIPDKTYEYYVKLSNKSDEQLSAYERLILNGKPLPKGHGRLIDGDDVLDRLDSGYDYDVIRYAPTVLEADNIEHACCYWKDNRCILNKNHCPDSYDCDDFD